MVLVNSSSVEQVCLIDSRISTLNQLFTICDSCNTTEYIQAGAYKKLNLM